MGNALEELSGDFRVSLRSPQYFLDTFC